ncbi:uncharacterized protein LOC126900499 [Daktulosphaira vitifoliae]|uniref:uncharacterized protein LOC126900499 n=1 Tax=Daktulosphaira vitifoliae TaxID=58002 RepID=UPI0021AA5CA0|nr:uncharacterized protein LOC126900499 [Daktulosphaira vitifoliae]
MIFFTILAILLFNSSLANPTTKKRHCDYSTYMLNFFLYCGHYLLQMENDVEKVNEDDLKKYKQAIQSHGDVVFYMVEELYNRYDKHFPSDLMAVNLYLNNLSESVNIISKNNLDNDIKNKKVFLGIQGIKIVNHGIVINLLNYINYNCSDVSTSDYGLYPNNMKVQKENLDQLINATYILRDKIFKIINSEIVKRNKKNSLFLPKNFFFYNLMTDKSENNLMNGTETRRHIELTNDKPKDILDLLRFTPLSIQCNDQTYLTLSDIFRFVKYQFSYMEVKAFIRLLLAATFRPVGLLIIDYTHFVMNIIENGINIKKHITILDDLGKNIINCLTQFKSLNIFHYTACNFLDIIFRKLSIIIKCSAGETLKKKNFPNDILNLIVSFLHSNKLKLNTESQTTVTEENVLNLCNEILQKEKQVDMYLIELDKYINSFNSFHIVQDSRKIDISHFKYFLQPFIIDNLCKENPIISNKNTDEKIIDHGYNEDFNRILDVGNNDGLEEFGISNIANFENYDKNFDKMLKLKSFQLNDYPKHMVDYIVYD